MFNKVKESKREFKQEKSERKTFNQPQHHHDQIYDVRYPIPSSNSSETNIIAIDCEMVQCEDKQGQAVQKLARLSVVNYFGHKLIDNYYRVLPNYLYSFKPSLRIRDFLTRVSGITPGHLKTAPVYIEEEVEKIRKLFKNKTIVGHSLKNDFGALNMDQSKFITRDIGIVNSLKEDGRIQGISLLILLGIRFKENVPKEGSHCSLIDARASLFIFRKFQDQINQEYRSHEYKTVKKQVYQDLKNMKKKKTKV